MNKTTEKRQFVRIVDNIMIAIKTIEEAEKTRQELLDNKEDGHSTIGHQLKSLEDQITSTTQNLSDKMPQTAQIFSLLNRKLNIIAYHMLKKDVENDHQSLEVSLSASGIGFYHHTALKAGDTVALDMFLSPNPYRIITAVKIISVNEKKATHDVPHAHLQEQGQGYYIRAEFEGLSEQDQEILIQHILRRQGQILKQKRLAKEANLS